MSDSYYPNKDGVASFSWPDPHWAVGGYPYHQHLSVPQSTHPELISAPGYASNVGWPGSYHVPDLNATNDGTFSLAPTIEMGAFANLPTQVDFTNPVSVNMLERRHGLTLLPQPVPNPWLVQALCTFPSCICHNHSYSPDANPKPSSMQNPRSPSRNWLTTCIGQGSLPLPPTWPLQHLM